jgi:hypothetical protein
MFIVVLATIAAFFGYVIGRWSHYWLNPRVGNPAWAPHHWIYGLLFLPIGWWLGGVIGIALAGFGVGLFLSDCLDFFCWRIYWSRRHE